jgi:hypothetical protein
LSRFGAFHNPPLGTSIVESGIKYISMVPHGAPQFCNRPPLGFCVNLLSDLAGAIDGPATFNRLVDGNRAPSESASCVLLDRRGGGVGYGGDDGAAAVACRCDGLGECPVIAVDFEPVVEHRKKSGDAQTHQRRVRVQLGDRDFTSGSCQIICLDLRADWVRNPKDVTDGALKTDFPNVLKRDPIWWPPRESAGRLRCLTRNCGIDG